MELRLRHMNRKLHAELKIKAAQESLRQDKRISLNDYILYLLEKALEVEKCQKQ